MSLAKTCRLQLVEPDGPEFGSKALRDPCLFEQALVEC